MAFIIFALTGNDGVFILERLLNGRKTDGPDIAVKHGGPMDFNDSDVVFVGIQLEVPVYPYFRHHEIQRPRLLRCCEIVLAESHSNVA